MVRGKKPDAAAANDKRMNAEATPSNDPSLFREPPRASRVEVVVRSLSAVLATLLLVIGAIQA
jgi:hypothetical protein